MKAGELCRQAQALLPEGYQLEVLSDAEGTTGIKDRKHRIGIRIEENLTPEWLAYRIAKNLEDAREALDIIRSPEGRQRNASHFKEG